MGGLVPTVHISFDSDVIDSITAAGPDGSVSLTINVSATPSASSAPSPSPITPRGPLAPLLLAGLLNAGDRLRFEQRRAGRTAYGTVRADGKLNVDGKSSTFPSPSRAASAVTGSQINGWTLWQLENNGRTLAQLRDLLDEAEDE
jgi:site-specific DNA-methyltransferase (adenine-specific)